MCTWGRSGVIALALPELQLPYFAEIAGAALVIAAVALRARDQGRRERSTVIKTETAR
jgi:hypothetical protein